MQRAGTARCNVCKTSPQRLSWNQLRAYNSSATRRASSTCMCERTNPATAWVGLDALTTGQGRRGGRGGAAACACAAPAAPQSRAGAQAQDAPAQAVGSPPGAAEAASARHPEGHRKGRRRTGSPSAQRMGGPCTAASTRILHVHAHRGRRGRPGEVAASQTGALANVEGRRGVRSARPGARRARAQRIATRSHRKRYALVGRAARASFEWGRGSGAQKRPRARVVERVVEHHRIARGKWRIERASLRPGRLERRFAPSRRARRLGRLVFLCSGHFAGLSPQKSPASPRHQGLVTVKHVTWLLTVRSGAAARSTAARSQYTCGAMRHMWLLRFAPPAESRRCPSMAPRLHCTLRVFVSRHAGFGCALPAKPRSAPPYLPPDAVTQLSRRRACTS